MTNLIDSRAIWNLRPEWIPGEAVRGKGALYDIKLSISLRYPNSEPLKRVILTKDVADSKGIAIGDQVLFSIKLAPENDRTRPVGADELQPDKVVVDEVRRVSNSEHSDAVRNYESTCADRINNLAKRLQADYDERCRGLEQKIIREAEKRIEPEHQQIAAVRKKHIQRIQKYRNRRSLLKASLRDFAINQNHLYTQQEEFEQAGGSELLTLIKQQDVEGDERQTLPDLKDEAAPVSLVNDLRDYFDKQNYSVDDSLLLQTLLCLCVGAATGQFIVLTGPPGSGKTSLVQKIAKALGAESGVVPVRPAWIDATDLIGFYNPGIDRYQPTPFLDDILRAKRCSEKNRLFLLVLDEMNLGRVENYAADFLSLMEKAREGREDAKLQLYSQGISDRFATKLKASRSDLTLAEKADLRKHLEKYPSRLPFPRGLVLFGTINVDETTHLPSPKFLDRSLTIQVSGKELPKELTGLGEEAAGENFPWSLSLGLAQQCWDAGRSLTPEAQSTWKTLVEWNDKYFKPLGIRLSHRLPQVYRCYMGAASVLNIPKHQAVADTFVLSKIMPLISFRRDDKAKLDLLESWRDAVETKGFPKVHDALTAIASRSDMIIRYLE